MALELQLLGKFRLSQDGEEIPVRSRKGQALLAYLALNGGRAQPREHLAGLLWGDRFDDQARRSLRQCVFSLRKDLGENAESLGGDHELVLTDVTVDVVKFEALIAEGRPESLEQAADMGAANLLAGLSVKAEAFDAWLDDERDRLAMRAHAAAGRRTEALKSYETCVATLRRELDTEPEPKTTQLHDDIRAGDTPAPESTPASDPMALPEVPSMAVLPFINMSGDPEQDLFADGIAGDIALTLSRSPNLFVIAYQSALAYKGRIVDLREVGRDLGVQYVVRGSARVAGKRIRVTAELADATTGESQWSQRYDRELDDLFDLQDELTREIVTMLSEELLESEGSRAWLRTTDNYEAWFCALEGWERWTRLGILPESQKGMALLEKAVALDPEFKEAWAHLCVAYCFDAYTNQAAQTDRIARVDEILAWLLQDDPPCPGVFLAQYWRRLHDGDLAGAVAAAEKGVAAAPQAHFAKLQVLWVSCHLGDYVKAERLAREVIRLNPYTPPGTQGLLGRAVFEQGREEEAMEIWRQTAERQPDFLPIHVRLAAEYALMGDAENTRTEVAHILRLDPTFRVTGAAPWYQSEDPKWRERLLEGLRLAGLPD